MEDWRRLKRAVFARHSNPWSAWTRWVSTPLMLVPVWRRSWRDAALVGLWMALNPVVFGKPDMGKPIQYSLAVDVAATAAGVFAMVAAYQRRAMPAATATALEMALLMAYWELMARYYDRNVGLRSKSLS